MDLSFSEKLVTIGGFYVPRMPFGWFCPECFAADYLSGAAGVEVGLLSQIPGVPLKFPRKRGFSV